jgi:hypothetical protein
MRTRDEHLEWCKQRAREERFDVWQYLPDDWHEKVGDNLSAEDAVKLAHSYTTRPAAKIGVIRKVHIIARDDDSVAFEWQFGKGVTFGDKLD